LKYGFQITTKSNDDVFCDGGDDDRNKENEVIVKSVPKILNIELTISDLRTVLTQLNEFDPLGHGLFIKPSIIQYILCSKACRSAIMFGDKLLKEECCELVADLAKCNFPFQCAHGRPSSILIMKDIQQWDSSSNKKNVVTGNSLSSTTPSLKIKTNISSNQVAKRSRREKWKLKLGGKVSFDRLC
jgi:hypothetical protein